MLEQIPSYNAAMNNINKHNFVVLIWMLSFIFVCYAFGLTHDDDNDIAASGYYLLDTLDWRNWQMECTDSPWLKGKPVARYHEM